MGIRQTVQLHGSTHVSEQKFSPNVCTFYTEEREEKRRESGEEGGQEKEGEGEESTRASVDKREER